LISLLWKLEISPSDAIRFDQQCEGESSREIHNTSKLSNTAKKDKVKMVLALINEIQIQDSCSSDEESTRSTTPPTKTAMVCKSAKILPEIWMTLPLEAKKWQLNERKHQQQADEKIKKFLASSKSAAVTYDKETSNSNMPNQYARMKNLERGENVIKDNTDQTYAFVDEFLEEAMQSSSRFQMLRHKRLNEVIATGTYFANETIIEGYHCEQVFLE
jgi:transcriptional regulator with PAS, ATPase and Fis domain